MSCTCNTWSHEHLWQGEDVLYPGVCVCSPSLCSKDPRLWLKLFLPPQEGPAGLSVRDLVQPYLPFFPLSSPEPQIGGPLTSWTFQQSVQNPSGKTRYRSGTDSVLSPELMHNQTTPKSAAESPFTPNPSTLRLFFCFKDAVKSK